MQKEKFNVQLTFVNKSDSTVARVLTVYKVGRNAKIDIIDFDKGINKSDIVLGSGYHSKTMPFAQFTGDSRTTYASLWQIFNIIPELNTIQGKTYESYQDLGKDYLVLETRENGFYFS